MEKKTINKGPSAIKKLSEPDEIIGDKSNKI